MSTCKNCSQSFPEESREGLPSPTHCPNCRIQRRLAFRNDWNLYPRACDLCKKNMVTIYSPDKNLQVYCQECYWGDGWDSTQAGRDFDFSRSFFEQFADLLHSVPLPNITLANCINCDYCTSAGNSKDCYLSARLGQSEGVLYTYLGIKSLDCTDCFNINFSQYCYGCVDGWSLYNCDFCQLCKNTSDSTLCYDCIGCKNCYGCVGLRNKEYCYFNEQLTKEEYERRVKFTDLKSAKERFKEHLLKFPHRASIILNSENVEGDCISNSKNVRNSYDLEQTEDMKNVWGAEFSKDISDGNFLYYGEKAQEVMGVFESQNVQLSAFPYNSSECTYIFHCFNDTKNCFGSVSLRKKQYCILNKQYSKEAYEILRGQIIEHMKRTGEWGEFFPVQISPFAYNETVAQEFFPLTRAEVEQKGLRWKEVERRPSNLQDENILSCKECERMFKLIPKELEIYKSKGLEKPEKCHICRHKERLQTRNPRQLWDRNCGKCAVPIQSTYSPDRPEIVYCEKCYLAAVY